MGTKSAQSDDGLSTDFGDDDSVASVSRSSKTDLESGSRSRNGSTNGFSIAATENKRVLYSKIALIVVLLAAAFGVGYSTWLYTTNTEEEEFESSVSTRTS